jgi:hypothetical protein
MSDRILFAISIGCALIAMAGLFGYWWIDRPTPLWAMFWPLVAIIWQLRRG